MGTKKIRGKRKANARNQRKIRRIFLGQENRRMIFSGIRKTAFAFRKIQKRKLNSNFREIEKLLRQ